MKGILGKTCHLSFMVLILASVFSKETLALLTGCSSDQVCTDLCGFQGEGKCIGGNYCKCADCPARSIYELAQVPKICTLDPTCLCPAPELSLSRLTSGKIYSGHRCLHGTSLVCICFCLPTNPLSLINVLKCPFVNTTSTTTTTTEAP